MAALLQDIGMLVLASAFSERYAQLVSEAVGDHARLAELEREALGTDHVLMGAWLQEKWMLPDVFPRAVLESHSMGPSEAIKESSSTVSCVALSNWVAAVFELPDAEAACRCAREAAGRFFLFSASDLHQHLVAVAGDFSEVAECFGTSDGTR